MPPTNSLLSGFQDKSLAFHRHERYFLCTAGRAPGTGRDNEGLAAELSRNSSMKWLFVAGGKWTFAINWQLKDRV